jgi:hypothetical protein
LELGGETVTAAESLSILRLLEKTAGLCVCPELENLSDGPADSTEPRPACPVHGTLLYGGETITHQELQRQASDMFEASVPGSDEEPGCPI